MTVIELITELLNLVEQGTPVNAHVYDVRGMPIDSIYNYNDEDDHYVTIYFEG